MSPRTAIAAGAEGHSDQLVWCSELHLPSNVPVPGSWPAGPDPWEVRGASRPSWPPCWRMQPSCSSPSQLGWWHAGPDPQDVASLDEARSQPSGQHLVASSGRHADTRLQQARELQTQPSAHEVPFAAEEPEVGHSCVHVCL